MSSERERWESHYAKPDPYGYETRWYSERKRIEYLARLLRGRGPFGRALDLGSGEGTFTRVLADTCRSIVSVEISGRALSRQKNRISGIPVLYVQGDAFRVAFRKESFDLLSSSEVLAYVRDRESVASEWCSWLRPGGTWLLVETLLPGYFDPDRLRALAEGLVRIEIVEALSSKHLIAKLANRNLVPFRGYWYEKAMEWTRRNPWGMAKHICILGRKPG